MANPNDNVLFVRSQDDDNNDPWDDSVLIRAFDSAIANRKKSDLKEPPSGMETDPPSCMETEPPSGVEFKPPSDVETEPKPVYLTKSKSKKHKKIKSRSWKIFDQCRAKYGEDGRTYDAIILDICGDTCRVRFSGFENEETVLLSSLKKRVKMEGQGTSSKHRKSGSEGSVRSRASSSSSIPNIPSMVPPPLPTMVPPTLPTMMPPPLPPLPSQMFAQPRRQTPASSDAYHAMLMSWYMSGYHTGYYECLRRTSSN